MMRQYRGIDTQGAPGGARPGPPRVAPATGRGRLGAGRSRRAEAAGRLSAPAPGTAEAKSKRQQEPGKRRLRGTRCPCPAYPRSELGQPVPAANSPARPAAPSPAPAARRGTPRCPALSSAGAAALGGAGRAGRAPPRYRGGREGCPWRSAPAARWKRGFPRGCAVLPYPILSSG